MDIVSKQVLSIRILDLKRKLSLGSVAKFGGFGAECY